MGVREVSWSEGREGAQPILSYVGFVFEDDLGMGVGGMWIAMGFDAGRETGLRM